MSGCTAACVSYRGNTAVIGPRNYECGNSGPLGLILVTTNSSTQIPTPTRYDVTTNAGDYTVILDPLDDYRGTLMSNFASVKLDGDVGFFTSECGGEMTNFPRATNQIINTGNATYRINLYTCCGADPGVIGVVSTYFLVTQTTLSSNGSTTVVDSVPELCPCKCPNSSCSDIQNDTIIEIPDITIIAQTTLDGQNLGEVDFIIKDTINYHCMIAKGKCKSRSAPISELTISCFQQLQPELIKVVKGNGCTLRDKLFSIYPPSNIIGIDFDTFIVRIIAYGMLKYILYRLLYGKFKISALLGKHNNQLLDKISGSRFCAFAEILQDLTSELFGYDVYFKYGKCG